jgi:hypothetical protein
LGLPLVIATKLLKNWARNHVSGNAEKIKTIESEVVKDERR